MKEGLKSLTLLGHPKTGPRRTLPTAKESQDLGRQRRYPVLGWPSSCIWKNFTPLTTMINSLNLTDTTISATAPRASAANLANRRRSCASNAFTRSTFHSQLLRWSEGPPPSRGVFKGI